MRRRGDQGPCILGASGKKEKNCAGPARPAAQRGRAGHSCGGARRADCQVLSGVWLPPGCQTPCYRDSLCTFRCLAPAEPDTYTTPARPPAPTEWLFPPRRAAEITGPARFSSFQPPSPKHARTRIVPAARRALFTASRRGVAGLPRRLGAGPGRAGRPDGTVKPRQPRHPAPTPEEKTLTPPIPHTGNPPRAPAHPPPGCPARRQCRVRVRAGRPLASPAARCPAAPGLRAARAPPRG